MSADLLAEFGISNPSRSSASQNTDPLTPAPPGVFDATFNQQESCRQVVANPSLSAERNVDGVEVLFDASIDQPELDEDDFGEFEGVGHETKSLSQPGDSISFEEAAAPGKAPTAAASNVQLVDLLETESGCDRTHPVGSNAAQRHEEEWDDYSTALGGIVAEDADPGHGQHPRAHKDPEGRIGLSLEQHEDDFFSEVLMTRPAAMRAQAVELVRPDEQSLGSRLSPNSARIEPATNSIRPTNIPPPATLLQTLPRVFNDLNQTKDTEPPTSISEAIIQAYTVSNRLIAGRIYRWKRDTILSQSTKIGPATTSSGGGRGMKLASIDRKETLKEDREVADVVQAWQRHAHHFASILHKTSGPTTTTNITTITVTTKKLPPLSAKPTLHLAHQKGTSTTSTSTSTSTSSILKSTYPCALCGLKREERIVNVDVDADDIFGEFWVDNWGHWACRDFWYRNEALLPQR
jgi:hypothetical protein